MSLSQLSAAVIQLMRQAELVHGYQRGEVTLEFDGFDLVVRGIYTRPERPAAFHPGQTAGFEVTEVYLADSATDAAELFDCAALSVAVLEHLKSQEKVA
ncbi:hypothetical protein [Aquitalea aquatilis]|uniref:hypothetical protein n=1 Tax=Aquitalea aquatilis TaxID=1537400 RepID=UPI0010BD70F3|nr:hypothetical protein [Aquitalea aquatilis]